MTTQICRASSSLFLFAALAFAQDYSAAPASSPPADVAPAIKSALATGTAISAGGKPAAEIWFRSTRPTGPKRADEAVTLPTIPIGALVGVIRFPSAGADRRGQTLKPGVYTLRYANYPVNGDHQGVAPQRDFLVLTPAADDKDLNSTPAFDDLMVMSRKASGTPHPAVLSFSKADADSKPGLSKQGESDWVLQTKLGDTPIAVIVFGVAAS